ncbi:MAG: alanine racemase [Pseudorhodoplanes sp.]
MNKPLAPVPQADAGNPAGPAEEEGCGILSIDLGAIVDNWRALGRAATPAECAAVIKADAYGCGTEPVARALAKAGCKTFFVAHLSEARRARAVAPDAAIYVLNGLASGTAPLFAQARLRPVIGSLVELAEWDAFVTTQGWDGGAALHVDTGMNRLGVSPDEAAAVAPRLATERHGLTLLMSHFVTSEVPQHPLNERQIATFREIRSLFRGLPASLSNSSGIYLGASAHCDLVRPGYALYGGNPTPQQPNPMQPVIGLQARIVQVRAVGRGGTVGYNATWTARHDSRIAIVSVGYGDGYLRSASPSDRGPGGEAVVAGKRCPIVGRISMDLLAIDVTALREADARRGDLATLIGRDLGVDEVAEKAGTIGYEILTSLGRRYARIYRGG